MPFAIFHGQSPMYSTDTLSSAIPKEHTVFRFQVPLPLDVGPDFTNTEKSVQDLVFEIHGSQFEVRAFDRANKKFKWKAMDYL